MRKVFILLVLLVLLVLISSCATSVPVEIVTEEEPSGFLMGFWHGLILPFDFIASLFNSDIVIYDINNTGWPYNLGFLLGVGGLTSSASSSRN